MFKNNKEREDYIRDEKNWELVKYDCVENNGIQIVVKDHRFPKIRLRRLKRTNIYRIEVMTTPMWYGDVAHYVEIGCKEFKENGELASVYDLTPNQLITYLREHKL